MPIGATPIHPMDAVPFSVQQEARLRRLCDTFVTQALQAVTHVEDRVALFQLLTNIPDSLLEEMTIEELENAVGRKAHKTFDFTGLDARVIDAWQGYNLVVDSLVPTKARKELVRHWFQLALIAAHTRARLPN